ncbi:hypothetical protein D3C76_871490 [compost metagenome]
MPSKLPFLVRSQRLLAQLDRLASGQLGQQPEVGIMTALSTATLAIQADIPGVQPVAGDQQGAAVVATGIGTVDIIHVAQIDMLDPHRPGNVPGLE